MEKPKSKQKSQSNEPKSASHRDAQIILISLAILYSIFTVTAFVKITYFWGINFLYYLPLWQKLLFIGIGGLIFIPDINGLLYKMYQKIANLHDFIQRRTQKFFPRVIYLLAISIFFAGIFYVFHVTSLYHDSMNAINVMHRNVSAGEYFKNLESMKNKYFLLLFYEFIRYVFYSELNISPYWTLAITSIILGIIFINFLDFFLRKLKMNPLHQLVVFIMIFTQAITFYYFGYANYYTLVPVFIFLYVLFAVLFFNNSVSIIYPLFIGIVAIVIHWGAAFIIPSFVFLLLSKYREKVSYVYNLFVFQSIKRTIVLFSLVIIIGYVLSKAGVFFSPYYYSGFVSLFSKPQAGYGWNLFSIGYVIHQLNMLLLISPIGFILFIVVLKHFRKAELLGELKYFLLWIALGGLLLIGIMTPQTMFAWDIYAWESIGYVVLGALLYLQVFKQYKRFAYVTTIVMSHALMYFGAWLALNNNMYAAVLNYLDNNAPEFKQQITVCLQIMIHHIRDPIAAKRLLIELEKKAETKEDYLWLSHNYALLADSASSGRTANRYFQLIQEAIEREPDNAYNYYQYLSTFSDEEKEKPENRDYFKTLYQELIQLEPNNIHYYSIYANYLFDIGEYQNSLDLYKKADSLYKSQNISLIQINISYSDIKIQLSRLSFNLGNYGETIKYFNEAVSSGANHKSRIYNHAIINCIFAYIYTENLEKAREMFTIAQNTGVTTDFNINQVDQVNQSFKQKDYLKFLRLFGPFTSNDNKILRTIYDIERTLHQDILKHTDNFILHNKYDSLLVYGNQIINCAPDSYVGYYLLGVYNKYMKKFSAADSLFDKGIELAKRNKIFPSDAIVKRMQEFKINR